MRNKLVSVIVLSYYSQDTIIETLESIYNQTHRNVELIISDDCSKDNTVKVARDWLKNHELRFSNVIINEHSENVGVTQNMIDALDIANGEWVKIIAADDLLFDDCIESNLEFAYNHKENVEFIVTNQLCFDQYGNTWETLNKFTKIYMNTFNDKTLKHQQKIIIRRNLGISPSEFFKLDVYKNLKVDFNISKNVEDWPFEIAVIQSGYKIYYRDDLTVKYRNHSASLSHEVKERYFNLYMVDNVKIIKEVLCYPHVKKYDVFYWWNEFWYYFEVKVLRTMFKNEKCAIGNIVKFILNCLYWDGWKENVIMIFKLFHIL